MSAERFPLHWPMGWPRTKNPQRSRFDIALTATRDGLFSQISLMGGRYPVLSSNLELRRDGLPYAQQREPHDAGVAVYFEWKGKQMVFACDRWDKAKDNVRAIEKTIEAMRGIERWGASDMLERALSAFEALPPPNGNSPKGWWEILGVAKTASKDEINAAFRKKAGDCHPDKGGTNQAMSELNAARQTALAA